MTVAQWFLTPAWKMHPFCQWCAKSLARDEATTDHIIPRAAGGKNTPGNLCVSCFDCNRDKGCEIREHRPLGPEWTYANLRITTAPEVQRARYSIGSLLMQALHDARIVLYQERMNQRNRKGSRTCRCGEKKPPQQKMCKWCCEGFFALPLRLRLCTKDDLRQWTKEQIALRIAAKQKAKTALDNARAALQDTSIGPSMGQRISDTMSPLSCNR